MWGGSGDPRGADPQTKVLLLGVFPRGEGRWDQGRINNQGINDLIAHHADGERVHYMDLGAVFMEPDGSLSREIMPDLLHLSPRDASAGRRRWNRSEGDGALAGGLSQKVFGSGWEVSRRDRRGRRGLLGGGKRDLHRSRFQQLSWSTESV